MSVPSFAVRADQALEQLIETIESTDGLEDVDLDMVDGVLTMEFEDGARIIVNRQEPLEQLWLATPLGPAHFSFDAASGEWRDARSQEPLYRTLERVFSKQLGRLVHF